MQATTSSLIAAACLVLAGTSLPAPGTASATEFGADRLLSEGAMAIQLGQYERGIELTEQGLANMPGPRDRAAALSNLCAAHVRLERYSAAFSLCNESLELNPKNWRTWNNRAGALLGLGLIRRAIDDVEHGLSLNPDARALRQTLEIARRELEARERERERGKPVRIDQIAMIPPTD